MRVEITIICLTENGFLGDGRPSEEPDYPTPKTPQVIGHESERCINKSSVLGLSWLVSGWCLRD